MTKVYADDQLIYTPQLPDYALDTLQVTLSADTSGTATITLPPGHPRVSDFVNYKTVVTIFREDVLLFRGRVLYTTDDFYNRRTITCEGERGFLQDSVIRPYVYQASPAECFATIIAEHNAQVDASKSFVVGDVTVVDANDYIRVESSFAEQTAAVLDKLIERVGGYIVFTTNAAGQRVINWYAEPGYRSLQAIEFGANLLDFAKTGANTDLATVIIPYGAANEETGERVTITSVNNGLDYIQDDEAVALRGYIVRPVYWDDVTVPRNLLTKAQQYLSKAKNIIVSLQVSAVDLSLLDKNIDTFQVLDTVRVSSKPHGVDEYFLLTDRTYDLLNPDQDTIVLGKEVATLTGADVAGDKDVQTQLHRTETAIRTDLGNAIASTKNTFTAQLSVLPENIMSQVEAEYVKGSDYSAFKTSYEQTAEDFTFNFNELKGEVDDRYEEQKKYIRFVDGHIELGEAKNPLELKIQKDRISFYDDGAEVAYFSNKKLTVTDGHFLNGLRIGSFEFLPRKNGNLSLVKVVE